LKIKQKTLDPTFLYLFINSSFLALAIFTNNNFKAVELLEQSASSNAWQQINPAQHPWF
jgi:hypothetical protein